MPLRRTPIARRIRALCSCATAARSCATRRALLRHRRALVRHRRALVRHRRALVRHRRALLRHHRAPAGPGAPRPGAARPRRARRRRRPQPVPGVEHQPAGDDHPGQLGLDAAPARRQLRAGRRRRPEFPLLPGEGRALRGDRSARRRPGLRLGALQPGGDGGAAQAVAVRRGADQRRRELALRADRRPDLVRPAAERSVRGQLRRPSRRGLDGGRRAVPQARRRQRPVRGAPGQPADLLLHARPLARRRDTDPQLHDPHQSGLRHGSRRRPGDLRAPALSLLHRRQRRQRLRVRTRLRLPAVLRGDRHAVRARGQGLRGRLGVPQQRLLDGQRERRDLRLELLLPGRPSVERRRSRALLRQLRPAVGPHLQLAGRPVRARRHRALRLGQPDRRLGRGLGGRSEGGDPPPPESEPGLRRAGRLPHRPLLPEHALGRQARARAGPGRLALRRRSLPADPHRPGHAARRRARRPLRLLPGVRRVRRGRGGGRRALPLPAALPDPGHRRRRELYRPADRRPRRRGRRSRAQAPRRPRVQDLRDRLRRRRRRRCAPHPRRRRRHRHGGRRQRRQRRLRGALHRDLRLLPRAAGSRRQVAAGRGARPRVRGGPAQPLGGLRRRHRPRGHRRDRGLDLPLELRTGGRRQHQPRQAVPLHPPAAAAPGRQRPLRRRRERDLLRRRGPSPASRGRPTP
jgi:hypothetical protein